MLQLSGSDGSEKHLVGLYRQGSSNGEDDGGDEDDDNDAIAGFSLSIKVLANDIMRERCDV
jgi:hypothetical protein